MAVTEYPATAELEGDTPSICISANCIALTHKARIARLPFSSQILEQTAIVLTLYVLPFCYTHQSFVVHVSRPLRETQA